MKPLVKIDLARKIHYDICGNVSSGYGYELTDPEGTVITSILHLVPLTQQNTAELEVSLYMDFSELVDYCLSKEAEKLCQGKVKAACLWMDGNYPAFSNMKDLEDFAIILSQMLPFPIAVIPLG